MKQNGRREQTPEKQRSILHRRYKGDGVSNDAAPNVKNALKKHNTEQNENKTVKIIPLGGLYEIGKNFTVFEVGKEILIVDCGMSFPGDDMLGIDVVIPDFTYLEQNREKIKGLIITHGHEDHIGGVPYLVRALNVPVYGTRLVLGLIQNKLEEHGLRADMHPIAPGQMLSFGRNFKVETIKFTHSISEAMAFAIETPAGVIFHTGDFKIDYTPLDKKPIDLQRVAEIGKNGVLLLMSDSTNSEKKGYTRSEQTVGRTLEGIFKEAKSRIIIASFASNIDRIQLILEIAERNRRKVAISGRSMVNIVELATELGYMKPGPGVLIDINTIKQYSDEELVIITTGSQGEPMSALTRMALNSHKSVRIKKNDIVIFSSSPIPGNEKTVSNVVNLLLEKGANVIYSGIADIHVSGHACQDEQKLIMALLKPKYFMPVHGEYRHLNTHAATAREMGIPRENIFLMKNGNVLEISPRGAKILKEEVPAGKIFVDGLGIGDIGSVVLRDRKLLSEAGLIIVVTAINRQGAYIVSGPEVISRGFVYVRESEELINGIKENVIETLDNELMRGFKDWTTLKNAVRDELRSFIFLQTKRNPMIIPVFIEV